LCFSVIAQDNSALQKEIFGTITHLGAPLTDVNIINKNQNQGTKTNGQGTYSIKANIGDVLQYSYIGFKTVTIVVEDITTVLNIEMITKINELDEAVVTVERRTAEELEWANRGLKKFKTMVGMFDPNGPYSIGYVDGEEIHAGYSSLVNGLDGKISGLYVKNDSLFTRNGAVIWDIDGAIYTDEPFMSLGIIKDIHVVKSVAFAQRYGYKAGGVVIVRTNNGAYDDIETKKKEIAEQYINKNYYKNDANKNYSTYSQENKEPLKEIYGQVTYLDKSLSDVNIINKNQNTGTKTNIQGNYTIHAKIGDIIQFSYIGFKTVNIIIEDITRVLNIEMIVEITELEETVVTTNTKGREYRRAKRAEKKFTSSMGIFDPKTAGYSVVSVDGEDINIISGSLTQALVGKLAGYYVDEGKPFLRGGDMSITQSYPAIWDVDGAVYTEEPPIDISQIKDIHVMKSLTAVNRYGNIANGGVIIVRTKFGSFDVDENKKKNILDQYTNKEYYNDDAIEINKESFITNPYTKILTDIKIKDKAFEYYTDSLKSRINEFSTHIGIAQDFNNYYKDLSLSLQILNDLAIKHGKNAEILKAIAFQMQEYDLEKDVIKIYESIFKIRPRYAQSYRDLANAYSDNQQYKKAWKLYMSYLFQGNDVSGEGIGELLYNEMEWLYFNRNSQSSIKVQFEPKSKDIIDFRNDIRMVFEWNTSEAEFDLEFVNPQKQVYKFEHSLDKNQDLITDEKKIGYSSKEFIIDDMKEGEWLVNFTYHGNKKSDPSYLKVTRYYYWGKPNQHKKITVYKFDKEREKIQLYRLNKNSLLVVNKY
jgi:hypothetical protein